MSELRAKCARNPVDAALRIWKLEKAMRRALDGKIKGFHLDGAQIRAVLREALKPDE